MRPVPALITRRRLQELFERHGVSPSRALGQNFVVDPNTIERIVRLAEVAPGDRVVEIGPGAGSLTLGLLDAGAEVLAVERDRWLLPVLGEVTAGRALEVVEADATTLDWSGLLAGRGPAPWRLVANLPYNVATTLVIDVLDHAPSITRGLVMVQAEVAERLTASPGTAAYGIPTVRVAHRATARLVTRVAPTVFWPQPRVWSALVAFERHPAPAPTGVDDDVFASLLATAFGQRRKMLRRSLAGRVPEATFTAAGIDPADRPQDLDLAAWHRLAAAVGAQ